MPILDLATRQLDYLQRTGMRADVVRPGLGLTEAPPGLRRLWRVQSVGRYEKALSAEAKWAGEPLVRPVGRLPQSPSGQFPTEDVLVGLYGYKLPLAFLVRAQPGSVALHLGVWSPLSENAGGAVLAARQEIVRATLRSLYPAISLANEPECRLPTFPRAGLALGVPTGKPSDRSSGALQMDRLIHALEGTQWAVLVLAQPLGEDVVASLRYSLINEWRASDTAAEVMRTPNPLAQYYAQLLELSLAACSTGQAVGMWRTAAYLLGDDTSYYRLSSVWRGIFSGEASLPEPVRVWDNPAFSALAARWAMPDGAAPDGPGLYRHPFEYQALLTSSQLGAYIHLPNLETAGYSVVAVPRFDMAPAQPAGPDAIQIGKIMSLGEAPRGDSDNVYAINTKRLAQHAFVAGVTGSGKTNTIFHILKEADAHNVPFLVIEPAKTEYRLLLEDKAIRHPVRVFTPGNETVSPFRLNPFEVPDGISVGVHLDLLRSVFSASFGMWTPLPQILEQALHGVYTDCGWDMTSGINSRVLQPADRALSFPTLSALSLKVDEVIRGLGYEAKITDDMRAALHTRLNSLRTGGKGRMLDVQRSFPIADLLKYPTVLELEGMGDDDDKAFMMGLLLIRLAEHRIVERRRGQQPPDTLQHLLVIEEAHRLLANVAGRQSPDEADPRGKAVETFANLLSEIRAYGQGVIVADQVPVKLAPDIIKNTNLKIAHRIVAEDDRAALAGSMVMDAAQARALATLGQGEAVAFAELDDSPLLIKVDKAKGDDTISDAHVAERMQPLRTNPAYRSLFLPFPACLEACGTVADACQSAQGIVESGVFHNAFVQFVQSIMANPEALDHLWPNLEVVVRAQRPANMSLKAADGLLRCVIVRAVYALAQRRGAQAGWSYSQTSQFDHALRSLLLAKAAGSDVAVYVQEFQTTVRDLHKPTSASYACCIQICGIDGLCLHRHAVADLIRTGYFDQSWQEANTQDASSGRQRRAETWEVARDAAFVLVEWPEREWTQSRQDAAAATTNRVALCFAQQMLAVDARKTLKTSQRIMEKVLQEAVPKTPGTS